MAAITVCPRCGTLYEEVSEEWANSPDRVCIQCANGYEDDQDESLPLPFYDTDTNE